MAQMGHPNLVGHVGQGKVTPLVLKDLSRFQIKLPQ
jgi:hypothetical protein